MMYDGDDLYVVIVRAMMVAFRRLIAIGGVVVGVVSGVDEDDYDVDDDVYGDADYGD